MGVLKWLRRERVTITTRRTQSPEASTSEDHRTQSAAQVGTIRTEEYKRDLAEFQARRLSSKQETPVKKRSGRHSLPVSCTDCASDPDNTFNYEKKSALKYKKKVQNTTPDKERLPNIQFLFQNQVFMPGNFYTRSAYSEPTKRESRSRRVTRSPEMEVLTQKQLNFELDSEQPISPPLFYKNNSLPFDVNNFLSSPRSEEEVDGVNTAGDLKISSQSSSESADRTDSGEEKLMEVMSELKSFDRWADEQLQGQSLNTSKSDDNRSTASTYGLPIASTSSFEVSIDNNSVWTKGKWGSVPVQIKKLNGVTMKHVKKKLNTEINILRKCRHPNIILLMGLYPNAHDDIHIVCELCVNSLYGILHVEGRILSVQSAVRYTLDIANALVFLKMQGYVHTELNSDSIMVTSHDAAKLADFSPCVRLKKPEKKEEKDYQMYSPEPLYVNIEDKCDSSCTVDREPLLSQHSSEAYIRGQAVPKDYKSYQNSSQYRWHAPELFEPDEAGLVYPCSKTDVYSLCLILWESCNAALPWKSLTYEKLKELYTLWKTGIRVPQDGTYPGGLLSLLQNGLKLNRHERDELVTLQKSLETIKKNIDELEYIIIPARLTKKKSDFSSIAWDTMSPTGSSSRCALKENVRHEAMVHSAVNSSSGSDTNKDTSKTDSSDYDIVLKESSTFHDVPQLCYLTDEDHVDLKRPSRKYELIPEKEFSSTCSTPISKMKARIKDTTPGALHRSDSTEYCSILSPDTRAGHFALNGDSSKDQSSIERPTAKLSRSFTPKSYKPLHIKVPDINLDSLKSLPKDQCSNSQSTYNFDIKNYSLPSTPIARSNKLRKNAWLSGEVNALERSDECIRSVTKTPCKDSEGNVHTPIESTSVSPESTMSKSHISEKNSIQDSSTVRGSTETIDIARNSVVMVSRMGTDNDRLLSEDEIQIARPSTSMTRSVETVHGRENVEDVLANVCVKPLVAIHEKWIYEANKKTERSKSLPEDHNIEAVAVKPASHSVNVLQKSMPHLYMKPPSYRIPESNANYGTNTQSEQFRHTKNVIEKAMNFAKGSHAHDLTSRYIERGTVIDNEIFQSNPKIDQATDTSGMEDFIKDLIRKEFQDLLNEMSFEDVSTSSNKNEEFLSKGIANVMDSLQNGHEQEKPKRETIKSFSRVKINGNNKPLLQITFSRSGESSLQVLDNCVNVTLCDTNQGKLNHSMDETTVSDDVHYNSLKRCQAFSALQEARSTEDLYIDDDLSTQMQENFGGRVKLIPLHGSLHEILCEKQEECCLIKVKQENGCDTIYFKCDNSDTESRDALDGVNGERPQDTVVFKRSISLVEERIQRIFPKEKRPQTVTRQAPKEVRTRPKSEVFFKEFNKDTRILSNSSPSLATKDRNEEVEVNIENVMCYQDSSSDECLKCHTDNDDFEMLERKIEEELANSTLSSMTCGGCLEKISEENLSVINEEIGEKEQF